MMLFLFFFFFQAEDGIRDHCVTGVQTCALPISQDALGGAWTRRHLLRPLIPLARTTLPERVLIVCLALTDMVGCPTGRSAQGQHSARRCRSCGPSGRPFGARNAVALDQTRQSSQARSSLSHSWGGAVWSRRFGAIHRPLRVALSG